MLIKKKNKKTKKAPFQTTKKDKATIAKIPKIKLQNHGFFVLLKSFIIEIIIAKNVDENKSYK